MSIQHTTPTSPTSWTYIQGWAELPRARGIPARQCLELCGSFVRATRKKVSKKKHKRN